MVLPSVLNHFAGKGGKKWEDREGSIGNKLYFDHSLSSWMSDFYLLWKQTFQPFGLIKGSAIFNIKHWGESCSAFSDITCLICGQPSNWSMIFSLQCFCWARWNGSHCGWIIKPSITQEPLQGKRTGNSKLNLSYCILQFLMNGNYMRYGFDDQGFHPYKVLISRIAYLPEL